jgi:hypothetical protein
MINKKIPKLLKINFVINVSLLIVLNIFSKMEIFERLIFSLRIFALGIFCLLFFLLLFYIIYRFNELTFQIFTIFFMIGSFVGIIVSCVNLLKDDPIMLSIIIPLINVLFLCLYIRIHIWKIDREKYIKNKRQNKYKKNENKIVI